MFQVLLKQYAFANFCKKKKKKISKADFENTEPNLSRLIWEFHCVVSFEFRIEQSRSKRERRGRNHMVISQSLSPLKL